MNLKRRFMVLMVIGFVCSWAVLRAGADEWSKTYTLTGQPDLRVDTSDANIHVSTWDQKTIEAKVTTERYKIGGEGIRIEERQTGDTVEIEVRYPHSHGVTIEWGNHSNHRVDIDIHMPREGRVDLHTGDGVPADHRLPYDIEGVIARLVDADDYLEFQPHHAPELLCANARLVGRAIGVIANRRGFLKTPGGPRIGGIVYPESARKVAYFVEIAERHSLPLLYLQDVSGFMVGAEAESEGIIRAGAEMVDPRPAPRFPRSC